MQTDSATSRKKTYNDFLKYGRLWLAYKAFGLPVASMKRVLPAEEAESQISSRQYDAAGVMALLLDPAEFAIHRESLVCKLDGDHVNLSYPCSCCGKFIRSSDRDWVESDVVLPLGDDTGFVAVHLTGDGIEWWFQNGSASDDWTSAAIDAGRDMYILFRSDLAISTGCVAPGLYVMGEGIVKLPPSLDAEGRPCNWVQCPIKVPNLPTWIIKALTGNQMK